MQVNTRVWKVLNPYNPEANIMKGAEILAGYKGKYGTWERALTAYNAGPDYLDKPPEKTMGYVRRIMGRERDGIRLHSRQLSRM